MERKIEITYHWSSFDYTEIPDTHERELKEHAEERVFKMRADGYVEGELYYEIENIIYSGWWTFNYVE